MLCNGFILTYNHRQAVGHGDEICTSNALAIVREVAGGGRARKSHSVDSITLVIFEPECPRVLADHLHIGPSQSCESFSGDLAEGGGEVDEVDAGEEFGHGDELGHGLDVPAGATTDLPDS